LTIVFGLFYPIFGPKKGVYRGVVATELAFLAQIHTMSVAKKRFLAGVATIWIWVYSTSILFLAISQENRLDYAPTSDLQKTTTFAADHRLEKNRRKAHNLFDRQRPPK
jgi:hypothetical protein